MLCIRRYYPGSFDGLRAKLKVNSVQRPSGYWTEEQTIEEARRFVNEHGKLTKKRLESHQRHDLVWAIKKIPGGIKTLREKL